MKHGQSFRMFISFLLVSLFLFAGCQSWVNDSSDDKVTVNGAAPVSEDPIVIGINYFPTSLFWYLAEDLGYFEDEGVNVEIKYYESIPDYIDAMFNDELDIVGLAFMDLFGVWKEGYRVKAIVAGDYSYGADAIVTKKGKNLDTLQSLKGQTIAVEQGAVSEFFLDFALTKRTEIGLDEVTKINYAPKEGSEAFINNEVDVIVTYEPYLQELLTNGDAQIIFDSSNERGLIEDVWVVEETKLINNRDAYLRAFKALFRALDYYKSNTDEAIAMIAKRRGYTPEEYAAQLEGLYILDLRDNVSALSIASGAESLYGSGRLILDFYKSKGIDKGMPTIDKLIDDSIVKEIFSNT